MEYGKIISVSGMSGLFELVGSKKDGAVVRSLEDKTTKFVSSRIHNFSHLESIEVYTTGENVNLVDVLKAMQESKETLPAEKDAAAIKAYFQKVFPEMDFERVYASDMKKMVKWYPQLKNNNVELVLSEEPEEDEEEIEEVKEEKPSKKSKAAEKEVAGEPKTAKSNPKEEEAEAEKPAPKKAAKATATKTEEKTDKPAPKKKAAAKKKAE
jgi:hypothetical protein